jgi:hypothetical protein
LRKDFKGVVRANSCPTEHVAATTALALHLRASAQQDPPIHLLPPGFGFSVWGLVFEPTHLQPPAKHTSNVDVIDTKEISASQATHATSNTPQYKHGEHEVKLHFMKKRSLHSLTLRK